MRTYERNGVHVDQCTDCRGIFLDRGELERLVDAENAYYEPPAAHESSAARQASAAPRQGAAAAGAAGGLGAVVGEVLRQTQQSRGGHGSYGSGQQPYGYPYGKKRKKKSFLDELFG